MVVCLLLTPPGPKTVKRRLCVASASGFVWSMNWASVPLVKKLFQDLLTDFEKIALFCRQRFSREF